MEELSPKDGKGSICSETRVEPRFSLLHLGQPVDCDWTILCMGYNREGRLGGRGTLVAKIGEGNYEGTMEIITTTMFC